MKTDAWAAKCADWAEELKTDADGLGNGLQSVVADLMNEYSAAWVLDAVSRELCKRDPDGTDWKGLAVATADAAADLLVLVMAKEAAEFWKANGGNPIPCCRPTLFALPKGYTPSPEWAELSARVEAVRDAQRGELFDGNTAPGNDT